MSFRIALASAVVLCAQLLSASPGQAGMVYVAASGTGTECLPQNPCALISQALNLAGVGGTVVCVTSPLPEAIIITRSVTIDCSAAPAVFRDQFNRATDQSETAIIINIGVAPADPARTVRLRGINIDGALGSQPGGRFLDRGIDIQSAAAVYIEDSIIANVKKQGILDHRTGGQTKLFIENTNINGNGGAGIVAVSAAVGITVLDNVKSKTNAYGIAVGTGNNVEIRNSVFSGNSTAGVESDSGSLVEVSNSIISHNNIGVQSSSSVRLFSNVVSFNNTAFSGAAATMGLNRFSSNVSMGTALGPVPGAPADIGP